MSLRGAGLCILLPAMLCPQQPTGEIRGAVIDELKALPLHTANVELRGDGVRRIVQSGAAGYRISGLPAGIYDLTISGSFLLPTTVRSVRLRPGEARVLPAIRLMGDFICGRRSPAYLRPLDQTDAARGGLAGSITDEHGQPLAGARVRVGDIGEAITDEKGRFSIDNLPAHDRYEIEVAHDGYYTEDFTDLRVQAGYEAVYSPEHLSACPKDRCDPALRPVRPLPACA